VAVGGDRDALQLGAQAPYFVEDPASSSVVRTDRVGKVHQRPRRRQSPHGRPRDDTRSERVRVLAGELDPRRRDGAQPTAQAACAATSSGREPQLLLHVIGLVARKMCRRERRASPKRVGAAGRESSRRVRQSVATVARRATAATARTPSKSPGEAAAKPASITSTRAARAAPRSPPSPRAQRDARDCSPSRSGVSKFDPARTHYNLLSGHVSKTTGGVNGGCMRPTARESHSP